MGSRQELQAALKHMENFQMHPVVDQTFLLDNAQTAFDTLEKSKQFGKIALQI